MRRATSLMLAVGLAAAGGMLAFQSLTATSGTFTGTISGGAVSSASSGTVDADSVGAALLGEDVSVRTLVATENNTSADAITIMGGRLQFVPRDVAANAYMYYDTSTGFYLANQLNLADGAFLTADNLSPKRNTQSLSVYGTYGITLVCQSTLGTCGTAPQVEGTMKTMCATASSKTRQCFCTASSNSSPTWAWENNLGVAGDATTCPEVIP